MFHRNYKKGFTLIELLIVIGILAILAGIVFVALDPLTRFRDARDSSRWADISAILSAVRVAQVDRGGMYTYGIGHSAAYATGTSFMIAATSTPWDCVTPANVSCDIPIGQGIGAPRTAAMACASLDQLVEWGYLGRIPVSPNGTGNWSAGGNTGYYVTLNSNNSVTVGACESENTASISVTR